MKIKSTPASPTKVKKTNGLWDGETWRCDCSPREIAALRTVKKNGPNFNKEFYTCKKFPYQSPCGFFQWKGQADSRSAAPEPPKSPPEPPKSLLKPPSTPPTSTNPVDPIFTSQLHSTPIIPPFPLSPKSARRKMQTEDSPSGAFDRKLLWHLSSSDDDDDEYEEYDEIEDPEEFIPRKQRRTMGSSPSKSLYPSLQQKLRSLAPAAPNPKLGVDAMPPVAPEDKSATDDIFTTPRLPPQTPRARRLFEPATPISQKRKFAAITPSQSMGESRDIAGDLIGDVVNILRKGGVDFAGVEDELREMLTKHARQKEGIYVGREIARQALTKKSIELIAMQTRSNALEEERKNAVKAVDALRESVRTAKNKKNTVERDWLEIEDNLERISEFLG